MCLMRKSVTLFSTHIARNMFRKSDPIVWMILDWLSVLLIGQGDSPQATYLVWLPVTKTFLSSPGLTTFLISMLV